MNGRAHRRGLRSQRGRDPRPGRDSRALLAGGRDDDRAEQGQAERRARDDGVPRRVPVEPLLEDERTEKNADTGFATETVATDGTSLPVESESCWNRNPITPAAAQIQNSQLATTSTRPSVCRFSTTGFIRVAESP